MTFKLGAFKAVISRARSTPPQGANVNAHYQNLALAYSLIYKQNNLSYALNIFLLERVLTCPSPQNYAITNR